MSTANESGVPDQIDRSPTTDSCDSNPDGH